MIRITALLLFLGQGVPSAQETWSWINPKPFGNSLQSVHFQSPQVGYAAGWSGGLAKTMDGGRTWSILPYRGEDQFYDIVFVGPQRGFVCGGKGTLMLTEDGGETWIRLPTGTTGYIRSLSFPVPDTGYAAAEQGKVLKTVNGGRSWIHLTTPIQYQVEEVDFLTPANGFAVGYNALSATEDGGATWRTLEVKNTWLQSVHFPRPDTGFACGSGGLVLRSRNGGATWDSTVLDAGFSCSSVQFTDARRGWLVGHTSGLGNPAAYKTLDGGEHWSPVVELEGEYSLEEVHFQNADTGHIVGTSGAILHTGDGGRTWSDSRMTWNSLTDAAFADSLTGYVVGWDGTLLRTEDAGRTWTLRDLFFRDINACAFPTRDLGYLATEEGSILKTRDGGVTWEASQPDGLGALLDIQFLNPDSGFVVGREGRIFRTRNGGGTWNKASLPPGVKRLQAVQFLDMAAGFAAGDSGTFLRTLDGGANWSLLNTRPEIGFTAIHFFDPENGVAVGTGRNAATTWGQGYFLKTSNGGQAWSVMPVGESQTMESLHFWNRDHGVIAGFQALMRTRDGGNTWQPIGEQKMAQLDALAFSSPSSGIGVGSMGFMVRIGIEGVPGVGGIRGPGLRRAFPGAHSRPVYDARGRLRDAGDPSAVPVFRPRIDPERP